MFKIPEWEYFVALWNKSDVFHVMRHNTSSDLVQKLENNIWLAAFLPTFHVVI